MKTAQLNEEIASVDMVRSVSIVDTAKRRAMLQHLENCMLQEPQVDIEVKHRFSGGIYSREIVIPKGTLLTGRIHKFDHFDIMLSGDISVSTDTGEVKRLSGLNIMEGKAGKKRAGYAHEETRWITFHGAEERDGEEMYEMLTCGSFEELENFNIMLDRADYTLMVEEMRTTEEEIQRVVTNEQDITSLPSGYGHVNVCPSKINGDGLFADAEVVKGSVIAPARIAEKRTIAGRYTNHAFNPNAEMIVTKAGVDLVALRDIPVNEEITVNYRNVIAHRLQEGDICQR